MGKGDRSVALDYHEATKHSYESLRTTPHFLDWGNQPLPFKLYRNLEPIELPPIGEPVDRPAERLTLDELSRILFHAAGVTKRRQTPGGEMLFRAAACTGALYHVEIYVVCGALEGLDAGVYHYGPKDNVLTQLRHTDTRGVLVSATGPTGNAPSLSQAPVALVLTSTFWRNAWKYRARAYRHTFWDSGTILAHVEAMATMLGLPARSVLGFADDEVNALIGVNADKEAAVAIVALGSGDESVPQTAKPLSPLEPEVVPLSPMEVDYPLIRETHRATSLASGDAAAGWRPPMDEPQRRLAPVANIEAVIRRRGSSRHFARNSISEQAARTVVSVTGPAANLDVPPLCDVYVIVNDVDGLSAGAYFYDRSDGALTCLKEGNFRREARYLDLEQELAGDASVNVYVLASLDDVVARLGERGYRAAQLEGGLRGGRMYLASYALGLGATGLTFFDDAVIEFFSPHAAGKSVMFLLAFGVPAKRKVLYQR